MKKLINKPVDVVREMLEGFVALTPGQKLLAHDNVVLRAALPQRRSRKVAVISGGGSGHEPAHAGYVGKGMLTAAVAGDVFTSPSSDAVLAAIRESAGPRGALLIVKNYTGDRLNFGLAAEMARAEGIPVEVVVVADDVALSQTVEKGRRRGIAGTVLVHKVAGAAAGKGGSLKSVAALARQAAEAVGSMGVSLGSCTVPAAGKPNFDLGTDEIELGLGIHGEPGVSRAKLASAAELTRHVLHQITHDMALKKGARLALVINGLGATPPMELAVLARDAKAQIKAMGFKLERAWCGTFLSALDMPGFSLSLMTVDAKRLSLLDAETAAPSWPGSGKLNPEPVQKTSRRSSEGKPRSGRAASKAGQQIRHWVSAATTALIAQEPALTELDAKAGDGDLGASLSRGAQAIDRLPDASWSTPSAILANMGEAMRRAIGGSSGPFYATALMRAGRALTGKDNPTAMEWADAFTQAVNAISELGGATAGDRTMVDALAPAAAAFKASAARGAGVKAAWAAATEAARQGCEATAGMKARLGRASYLGARAMGIPDAGAAGVVCWMEAMARAAPEHDGK
jgi:dihydroxyacetone kinase